MALASKILLRTDRSGQAPLWQAFISLKNKMDRTCKLYNWETSWKKEIQGMEDNGIEEELKEMQWSSTELSPCNL